MQKLISLFLSVVLIFALTSCGAQNDVSEPLSDGVLDKLILTTDSTQESTTTTAVVDLTQSPDISTGTTTSASTQSVVTTYASTAANTSPSSSATKPTQSNVTTATSSNAASTTTTSDGPIVATTTHRHSWIKTTQQPPTCTEQGYTLVEYSCGNKEKKDYVPALGHNMSDWRVSTHPTNKTPGESCRECIYTNCKYTETKQIPVLPMPKTNEQKAILDLVNAERAKVGLHELSYYLAEQAAADQRAEDIKVHFAHYRPNGSGGDGDPFYVLLKGLGTDYFGCGENVAMHFHEAAQVMKGWMDSPKHKANILDPDFDALVVGFSDDYWVQLFIDFD